MKLTKTKYHTQQKNALGWQTINVSKDISIAYSVIETGRSDILYRVLEVKTQVICSEEYGHN